MLPPMTAASTARMLWLGTAVLLWSASTQVIDAADAAAPTFESMARACRATGRKCMLANSDETSLPPELVHARFGALRDMTDLALFGNSGLTALPTEFGALRALRSLAIQNNPELATLPTELGRLGRGLAELRVTDSNALATLPTELGALAGLTELTIYGLFTLAQLPTELAIAGLRTLELVGNDAAPALPTELGALRALTALKVSDDDDPVVMPTELGALRALELVEVDGACAAGREPLALGRVGSAAAANAPPPSGRVVVEPCPFCPAASVPRGESAPKNARLREGSCEPTPEGVAHGSSCEYVCAPRHARNAAPGHHGHPAAAAREASDGWAERFALRCDAYERLGWKQWLGRDTGCVPVRDGERAGRAAADAAAAAPQPTAAAKTNGGAEPAAATCADASGEADNETCAMPLPDDAAVADGDVTGTA